MGEAQSSSIFRTAASLLFYLVVANLANFYSKQNGLGFGLGRILLRKVTMQIEQVYKVSSGFKIGFWILAVFCFLLIIMIPAGVLILYIVYKAEVRLTHDMFERRWVGKKSAPWNEIVELKWLPAVGMLQRAMRPMRIVAKNPTRTVKIGLPVGAFERSEELIAELQKRSGKTISK